MTPTDTPTVRTAGTLLLALLTSVAWGCACGVDRHPHEYVIEEIRDDDILLDELYCPNLDLVGIRSAPWFRGAPCPPQVVPHPSP